jgi:tetrahydromethanopterin:alpha-L-glutamate ligase
MSRLALAAVVAVGADYAGVDLIRDASGRLLVLEINSNPAWKGLQSVTATDIADTLAADFLAAVTQLPALA